VLKTSIGAMVMMALASLAYAGDQGEPDQSCDGNTFQMVECLKGKTAQWDKRMTIAYQQALKDAGEKQREQLRAAQDQVPRRQLPVLRPGRRHHRPYRCRRMHAQRDEGARRGTRRPRPPVTTVGKTNAELTQIANEALRCQPGCETASIAAVQLVADVRSGRNWEIPNVALGDSLISDVDRAVITLHHRLGQKFHLLRDD
jgi:hypothetical protein